MSSSGLGKRPRGEPVRAYIIVIVDVYGPVSYCDAYIPNIICVCREVAVEVHKLCDAAFFFLFQSNVKLSTDHILLYTRCVGIYNIIYHITLNAHQ